MKSAIIGAGMAGLACAESLRAGGVEVTLFDKGRHPAGRLSTRRVETRLGPAAFDHGAQYFTARDPAFRARVQRWSQRELAAPWLAAGEDAWVGTPGMSAPAAEMAEHLDVRWSTRIAAVTRRDGLWHLAAEGLAGSGFDTVVVAVPAEQVAALVASFAPAMAALAGRTPSQPCWTLMASFAEALPISADVLARRGDVAWAARNSAKAGRSGPEAWVVQASADWSREHLEEDGGTVAAALLRAFGEAAGIALPHPLSLDAHRWRYAKSGAAGVRFSWDATQRLGICGDWLIGPRVEAAWMSGTALATAIIG